MPWFCRSIRPGPLQQHCFGDGQTKPTLGTSFANEFL